MARQYQAMPQRSSRLRAWVAQSAAVRWSSARRAATAFSSMGCTAMAFRSARASVRRRTASGDPAWPAMPCSMRGRATAAAVSAPKANAEAAARGALRALALNRSPDPVLLGQRPQRASLTLISSAFAMRR